MRDAARVEACAVPSSSLLRADQEVLSGSLETAFSGVAAYPIDRVPDELSAVKYRWNVVESLSTWVALAAVVERRGIAELEERAAVRHQDGRPSSSWFRWARSPLRVAA